ncbi:MAG: PKD domain-containing protein [Deltaproteobacteria bacterium]|nr:MAG: PKD domain-containing protein [Deltaproteobacteria bacterium]
MGSTDDGTTHSARRYSGAAGALCLLSLVVLGLPATATGSTTTIPGAPMTLILLDTQGGRHQIKWNGTREVYPNNDLNGDSGNTLFFNGTSYGFSGSATTGTVGANVFGISSQSALLGSGTAADPWRVVTTLTTDGTVTVTQTAYYVNGDNYATFKWTFASTANYNGVKFFHGADAFPQAQDNGYGAYNAACNGLSASAPQVGPNFFEEFIPVTAPSAYRETVYNTGWSAIRSGTLNDTVNTAWHDAWLGFEWDFNLAAGGYESIFQKVAFGGSACSASSAPPPYLVPSIASAAAASPNPALGTTTDLSVLGADDGGEANLTYTWAVTAGPSGATFSANGTNAAKDSTATFTQAGTYTFQVTVTDQDGFSTTSQVTVDVQQSPTSVTVSPASATVDPNATQAFTATLYDQFGDVVAPQPTFAWLVSGGGTIDASGLFTAGGLGGGPFTVTATDPGSGVQGTASVTIQNDAPAIAIAAAASPDPVTTGTTTDLTVLGADDGGEANLTYTWAVTAGPNGATFNANGTNAAKASTATFTQAGTYTVQVTVTDQDGLTVTSQVVVPVEQEASSVTVSPASATVDPNATQAFTATLEDQFGDPMASQPAFAWMVSGGGTIDAAGLFTAGGSGGGPFTVTATDAGSGLQGTASVTIQNDAPTIAVAAAASPNPVTTGTTTSLSVLGADDGGEANLAYTWAVTAGPGGATFSANGTNAAKSSTATFTQAGTYTVRVSVTDQDGLTVTSQVVVPVQQHASSVTVSPASATVDPNATQAFAATLKDQFGDPMGSQPAFTWTASGGGTIDGSGLFTAGGSGGGPFTVTATDPASGLQSTASITIQNDAPTVAVAAAASPNPVTTGTTTDLTVLGADDGGETHLTYTWAVTAGPSGATFNANGTNAAKTSTATFTQAGTYTVQVTVTDQDGLAVTSQVVVPVEQHASSVTVSPASATVHPNGARAFTATLEDQFGNAMASQPAFTWMVSGGGAIDASGLFTAGSTGGGPFTVTATDAGSGLQGTASVTIQNDAPTIASAAAASPNPVTAGTTTGLSVLGADDGGETHLTYTWAVTAGPGGATFNANGTNAAKTSTATFIQAGTYTFQVTVTDQDGLTVTSQVVVPVAQHPSSVTVSPASATVDPNATQAFTATLKDQFAIAMASQPTFSWTVTGGGAIDTSGLFTAGGNAGGPFTVTASDPGSGVQGTASVTIQNGGPTIAVAAAASPNPVATGTTTSLSVLGADDGGETHLTYTWAVTAGPSGATFSANGTNAAKSSTATLTQAGTYTFRVTVTDQDGLTVTSQVVVPVQQHATSIWVSPGLPTVAPNATQAFTPTLEDQFGHPMASQPTFGWTVSGGGTIDAGGLFTAGGNAGGPFTVTATDSGSSLQGTASVTIGNSAPTVSVGAAASPNPVTAGTTTDLTVLGADDGGEAHLTYTWAVTSGPSGVTFSANGTNAAKSSTATFTQAGTYTFQVTISDQDGLTVTSQVTVVVQQHVTTITVNPPSATVSLNGTANFTATAYDQFAHAFTSPPTFTWTVAGGGTIDAAGTFHAGGTVGSFTVTASVGAVHSTATVRVKDMPPFLVTPPTASPNPSRGPTTTLDVLADDDGGEEKVTYTWSASGPGTVSFAENGTNAARTTTASFSDPGVYTITLTLRDASGNTTKVTLVVKVQEGLTVSDANLYVGKATFTIAWNRHRRGQDRDSFALTGFINPAGLPVSLAGTTMEATVDGAVLASGVLSTTGTFRGSSGTGPRVSLSLSNKSGKYTVRVSRDDLRPMLAVDNETGSRPLEVPVTLFVSRARTAMAENRLEFSLVSTRGRRSRGSWRGPKQRLLDGAFQTLRTKVVCTKVIGGYVMQASGVIYPMGSGPVMPTGDVTVRLADGDPVVIPLAALRRGGASEATSTWKYTDKTAPVSAFLLKNTKRAFTLKTGLIPVDALGGLPLGRSVGTRGDVAIRIDIPTAQGTIVFRTTPELVRAAGPYRWTRPAPLLR